MYKVAVPVTNRYNNREMDCEKTLTELKKAGAARIWLCCCRGIENEKMLSADIAALKKHIPFFENAGLEVGVWISSLGHGGELSGIESDYSRADKYVLMQGVKGGACRDSFCPSGEAFAEDFSNWIARLAGTGVKMIMLDDDYRLSLRSIGNGCCCDYHMKRFEELTGEKVERKDLEKLVFTGGRNKYRTAWIKMNGEALIGLSEKIRAKVDMVNKNCRVGFCSVMSTWGADGTDAIAITKALAGSTKPFLRTIGAPYWVAMNPKHDRLSYIVNSALMQKKWCEGEEIELFTEGDAYPRPRYATPAAYLEMFDMMLRASGGMDGILKYMMDYTASPDYEKGYIRAMARHRPIYDWIDSHFSGTAEGVDAFMERHCFEDAEFPADNDCGQANYELFHTSMHQPIADMSLPICFTGKGVHCVWGESVKHISDDMLKDGLLIDAKAALILTEKGVDVGIEKKGEYIRLGGREHYIDENEYVATGGIARYNAASLRSGANVLSEINGKPTSYTYENADGQRFVVLLFDMIASSVTEGVFRSYSRQRQITAALEWAGRKKLPAVCPGNPDLYIVCRRDGDKLTVGLFNLSADEIFEPEVTLDREYRQAELFGAEGILDGDTVKISTVIAPYSFTGIALQ